METANQNMKLVWTGRAISFLVTLPFLMSVFMIVTKNPQVYEGMKHAGMPESLLLPVGILQIACILIYLIPATSVMGAVLLTGYLGGAVLTHLRIGEAIYIPIVLGGLIWLGLYLREPRLRELLPLRRSRT